MAHTSTRLALGATGVATALVASLAVSQPAEAHVNPGYVNRTDYTTSQEADWETMSNLPMVDAIHMPAYGWRAGFRVRVGVRWDSGIYYGGSAGSVEARAEMYVDTPAGRERRPFTLVAVHAVPAFNGAWIAGCQAHMDGWNQWAPVAQFGSSGCSAPTVAGPHTNYQTGTYSACVVVTGLAFPDQPTSWFTAPVCPPSAYRI